MPDRHLDALELARALVRGPDLACLDLGRFAAHLARGCEHCLEAVEELTLVGQGLEPDAVPEGDARDGRVGQVFERALEESGLLERVKAVALQRRQVFQEERRRSEVLAAEGDAWLGRCLPKIGGRALCELVLDQVQEAWLNDLGRAGFLAQVAIRMVDGLDGSLYGKGAINDLKALGWAYVANTRRLEDDFKASSAAFAQAESWIEHGSGDPLVQARISSLRANLFKDQRWFPEAEDLLETSIAIYDQCGETHRAGRCQLSLATLAELRWELAKAVALIEEALERLDFRREPNLELLARHNLMTICSELDPPRARQELERWRHLYLCQGKASLTRRLPWLEGKIALGHGELDAAESHLRAAAAHFLDEDSRYTWALVSLDLAAVYALQHRPGEVLDLAESLWTTFASLAIHQEAFAALLLFVRAAREEALTLDLIRETASVLRQPPPRRERLAS